MLLDGLSSWIPCSFAVAPVLLSAIQEDKVVETIIDPLNPGGMSMGAGNSSGNAMGDDSATNDLEKELRADSSSSSSSSRSEEDSAFGDGWEAKGEDAASTTSSSDPTRASGGGASSSGGGGNKGDGGAAAAAAGGRHVKARCWMAQEFPMQLRQLIPLLDIIGAANPQLAKVAGFLHKAEAAGAMFPVKVQVPLLLTVYAMVNFKAFTPLVPPESSGGKGGKSSMKLLGKAVGSSSFFGGGASSSSASTGSSSGSFFGVGGSSSSNKPQVAPEPEFFRVPEGFTRKMLSDVVEKHGGMMGGRKKPSRQRGVGSGLDQDMGYGVEF